MIVLNGFWSVPGAIGTVGTKCRSASIFSADPQVFQTAVGSSLGRPIFRAELSTDQADYPSPSFLAMIP